MTNTKKKTTTKKKKRSVPVADQLFTMGYFANLIGRSFKKFPSMTATEVAQELTTEFLGKWNRKQHTHLDDMDEFFMSDAVQTRIKEVAASY